MSEPVGDEAYDGRSAEVAGKGAAEAAEAAATGEGASGQALQGSSKMDGDKAEPWNHVTMWTSRDVRVE
jgi:hypothetical protein